MDIVPIVAGASSSAYNPDAPAIVNFFAGPNRWAWSLTQAGNILQQETGAYGELTGQFAELALLWATYRLDSVKLTFVPNNTGAGS